MEGGLLTPEQVHAEFERVRETFHWLVETSSAAELRRPTDGTRWTNSQLSFHMLLGYFVVRSLLGLVRTIGRMPDGISRRFARVLNAGTRPFHLVNYLGGCAGALVLRGPRLTAAADRTIDALIDGWRARAARHRSSDALPDRMGSVLRRDDVASRGVPLRHHSLRLPPPATDPVVQGLTRLGDSACGGPAPCGPQPKERGPRVAGGGADSEQRHCHPGFGWPTHERRRGWGRGELAGRLVIAASPAVRAAVVTRRPKALVCAPGAVGVAMGRDLQLERCCAEHSAHSTVPDFPDCRSSCAAAAIESPGFARQDLRPLD